MSSIMKVIAAIVLVWLVCLLIGAAFGVLGKLIWIAILGTAVAAIYGYIKRNE